MISFGVNHLSHMLLTHILLPLMEETRNLPSAHEGDVRIVSQASEQHRLLTKDVKFESLEEVQEDIGGNDKWVLVVKIIRMRKSADKGILE